MEVRIPIPIPDISIPIPDISIPIPRNRIQIHLAPPPLDTDNLRKFAGSESFQVADRLSV